MSCQNPRRVLIKKNRLITKHCLDHDGLGDLLTFKGKVIQPIKPLVLLKGGELAHLQEPRCLKQGQPPHQKSMLVIHMHFIYPDEILQHLVCLLNLKVEGRKHMAEQQVQLLVQLLDRIFGLASPIKRHTVFVENIAKEWLQLRVQLRLTFLDVLDGPDAQKVQSLVVNVRCLAHVKQE